MNNSLLLISILLILICFQSVMVMAEWVAIKPTELYYNYVAVTWSSDTTALAAGYSVSGGVMMRTTDKGLTWTSVATDVSFGGLYGLTSKTINNVKYFVAVDELGLPYVSVGSDGVSWTANVDYLSTSLLDVSIGSNGKAFICGSSSSVYIGDKSTNFTSWTSISPTTPASATFNGIR